MDLQQLTDEVEAVSNIYARKHRIDRDDTWFLLKLQEEIGELTQVFLMRAGQARDKGCPFTGRVELRRRVGLTAAAL